MAWLGKLATKLFGANPPTATAATSQAPVLAQVSPESKRRKLGSEATDATKAGKLAEKCPSCGNIYAEDAIFCRMCGKKRPYIEEAKEPQAAKRVRFSDETGEKAAAKVIASSASSAPSGDEVPLKVEKAVDSTVPKKQKDTFVPASTYAAPTKPEPVTYAPTTMTFTAPTEPAPVTYAPTTMTFAAPVDPAPVTYATTTMTYAAPTDPTQATYATATTIQATSVSTEEKVAVEVTASAALSAPIGGEAPLPLGDAAAKAKRAASALEEQEDIGRALEEKYSAIFDEIDASGDGELQPEELEMYVAKKSLAEKTDLGMTNWKSFLKEADTDGDGQVSKAEFIAYFTHEKLDKAKAFGALFDAIDVSGDGELQYDEVRDFEWYKHPKIFQLLGIPNFSEMAKDMDDDGDGNITRKEFMDFWTKKQKEEQQASASPAASATTDTSSSVGAAAPVAPQKVAPWKQSAKAASEWSSNFGYSGKKFGAGVVKRRPDECWDYTAGYCSRGNRCRWAHIEEHRESEETLNAHRTHCLQVAKRCGVNLNAKVLTELQSLQNADATELIESVAAGGKNEHVQDKNFFLIHAVHRIHIKNRGTEEWKRTHTGWNNPQPAMQQRQGWQQQGGKGGWQQQGGKGGKGGQWSSWKGGSGGGNGAWGRW